MQAAFPSSHSARSTESPAGRRIKGKLLGVGQQEIRRFLPACATADSVDCAEYCQFLSNQMGEYGQLIEQRLRQVYGWACLRWFSLKLSGALIASRRAHTRKNV
jgi:hypothetical protein